MLEIGEIITVHADFIIPDGALGKILRFTEESVDGPLAAISFLHEITFYGKRWRSPYTYDGYIYDGTYKGFRIWIKVSNLKKLED